MNFRSLPAGLAMVLGAALGQQASVPKERPVESEHRGGPRGLAGWTLSYLVPDSGADDRYPMTLLITRNGRVIRRIEGEPFVWSWIFLADGKQLAIMVGPLHFGMNCILEDLSTGKALATYDCYHEEPQPEPDWVKALEAAH